MEEKGVSDVKDQFLTMPSRRSAHDQRLRAEQPSHDDSLRKENEDKRIVIHGWHKIVIEFEVR